MKDRPDAVNDRGVATEKGLGYLCEFIAAIRDVIGWSAPLAADHFGPLNVQDSIRYAKAFEHYQLAWAEDLLQIGEGQSVPVAELARLQNDYRVHHHAHQYRRRYLRTRRGISSR